MSTKNTDYYKNNDYEKKYKEMDCEKIDNIFPADLVIIANSGNNATIIGGSQDNDQANKSSVDQSNEQSGIGNTGTNTSDPTQDNTRTRTNG